MRKISTLIICILIAINLTSCIGDKVNPKIAALGLKDSGMQRIAITNNRYAGRYTIIDKKAINDFTKTILYAKDASKDSKYDPDFIFDFYDSTKNVASFKYIVGIDDKNTANLIDMNGNLYRVDTSVENEFMKRLMKSADFQNVPEYYVSLLNLLIKKSGINKKNVIVVDISTDYVVTRSLTSVQQQNILNSVNTNGGRIVLPSYNGLHDFIIKISTTKYTDDIVYASASVTDKNGIKTKYDIIGTFEDGGWNYHIKYK